MKTSNEIPYCFTVSFKGLRVVGRKATPVPLSIYRTEGFQSRHHFQADAMAMLNRLLEIARDDVAGRMANGDANLYLLCSSEEQAERILSSAVTVASGAIRLFLLRLDNDGLMRMWNESSHSVTLRELTDLVMELREKPLSEAEKALERRLFATAPQEEPPVAWQEPAEEEAEEEPPVAWQESAEEPAEEEPPVAGGVVVECSDGRLFVPDEVLMRVFHNIMGATERPSRATERPMGHGSRMVTAMAREASRREMRREMRRRQAVFAILKSFGLL